MREIPSRSAGLPQLRRLLSDPPPLVPILIAVNVLVFLAEALQSGAVFGRGSSEIRADGALFGPAVADGEWWRLVTSAFIHADLIHLGFNMLLLWWLGTALESFAGPARFLFIYVASILWGSAGALYLDPNVLTIGASGGVFGLMAAVLWVEQRERIHLMGGSVWALLLLNLAITFAIPGISIGGHLGGILGGVLAALALSELGRRSIGSRRRSAIVLGAGAGVIVGAVAVALSLAG